MANRHDFEADDFLPPLAELYAMARRSNARRKRVPGDKYEVHSHMLHNAWRLIHVGSQLRVRSHLVHTNRMNTMNKPEQRSRRAGTSYPRRGQAPNEFTCAVRPDVVQHCDREKERTEEATHRSDSVPAPLAQPPNELGSIMNETLLGSVHQCNCSMRQREAAAKRQIRLESTLLRICNDRRTFTSAGRQAVISSLLVGLHCVH